MCALSVTHQKLLDPKDAKQLLTALRASELGERPRLRRPGDDQDDQPLTELELVELLLDFVNDGALSVGQWSELVEGSRVGAIRAPPGESSLGVSESRLAALRAFLEERVRIRERTASALVGARRKRPAEGSYLPQHTVALAMAAEQLPLALKDRVSKKLAFRYSGGSIVLIGKARTGPRRGRNVHARAAGSHTMPERWVSDSRETALNLALLLVLDPKRPFGADLCRCHLTTCGRFWLLDRSSKAGKPVRNYHDRKCAALAKRAAAKQRKANQRKRERSKARARRPAKPK